VFAAPEYQWEEQPKRLERLWSWLEGLIEALFSLKEQHPAAYYAVLALLAAVLLLVLSHIAYVLWRILRPQIRLTGAAAPASGKVRGPDWYIEQARQATEKGSFGEALGLRFRALLLRLDRAGAVSFHPSKTPAEYLIEVKLDQSGVMVLSDLVGTLYRHLFGGVTCEEGDVLLFDRHASMLESRGVSA